ncbi:MAG: YigZ family protein [Rhodothermia bacterium]|nr:MAG: YigZ family protein [Rhodothermia bacterium]
MSDTYCVLGSTSRTEIKVKGSRFIGEAIPVGSPREARDHLNEIKRREHSATHHCMAYRMGPEGAEFRFNDDGEPSGTAGRPILRQIEAADLTNTMVVVTRYYGGKRLGTGGLIRAYGNAASDALSLATVQTVVQRDTVRATFAYNDTSPAMRVINKYDAEIRSTDYGEKTTIDLGVKSSQIDDFLTAFENALGGRCVIDVTEED